MTVTQKDLAQRLREAREASKLTQDEVARHLEISRPAVAQLESGNRAVSSLELDGLSRLYGRDIREFFADEFRPEESVIALFRAASAAQEEVMVAVRSCAVLAREIANLEEILGLRRSQHGVPSYATASPRSRWQAIEQGGRAAADERRRLGLSDRPVGDVVGLLEDQGVRTAMIDLPDDISGLTLMQPGLSLLVVANRQHHLIRRRFSWIHEYAHVVLDRSLRGTLSRLSDREALSEVRANSFAACFLLPEEGVRAFLAELGKGQPGRVRLEVFDGSGVVPVEARPETGSQKVQLHDVVLLADHFGVSRTAALYRLRNLHLLSSDEITFLLSEENAGRGRSLARLLGLPEPDHAAARDEFRSRFLGLALEAFRREKISGGKLRELSRLVEVSAEELDRFLDDTDLSDAPGDVLLPEGLD